MAMPMMDERVQRLGAMRAKSAPAPAEAAPEVPNNAQVIEEVKTLLGKCIELLASVGGRG